MRLKTAWKLRDQMVTSCSSIPNPTTEDLEHAFEIMREAFNKGWKVEFEFWPR